MTVYTCETCGHADVSPERFDHHLPCNPSKTVWVSCGGSGIRSENTPEAIAVKIAWFFKQYKKADSASVHHGKCRLGVAAPGGCDCYPTTVLRERASRA